jgi:hypothetical protein
MALGDESAWGGLGAAAEGKAYAPFVAFGSERATAGLIAVGTGKSNSLLLAYGEKGANAPLAAFGPAGTPRHSMLQLVGLLGRKLLP